MTTCNKVYDNNELVLMMMMHTGEYAWAMVNDSDCSFPSETVDLVAETALADCFVAGGRHPGAAVRGDVLQLERMSPRPR